MEIWQKLSIFQTTSQRLADQVRTIMKKGWFSELEIIEIHQKINDQDRRNTLPDTPNINKQKQPIQKWTNFGKWKPHTTKLHPTKHYTTKQPSTNTRTKVNFKNLKRILNSEKTTLPSLRNIEWRIVKAETNKVNQVLTYIPTNNNRFKWTNLCWSKISLREHWDPLKKHESKVKTRMGISTRNSDRKPTKITESGKTKEKRWNK